MILFTKLLKGAISTKRTLAGLVLLASESKQVLQGKGNTPLIWCGIFLSLNCPFLIALSIASLASTGADF